MINALIAAIIATIARIVTPIGRPFSISITPFRTDTTTEKYKYVAKSSKKQYLKENHA
jgi:hypothetical protein